MNKIENIIFDFGGVLYDIDLQKSIAAFKSLGFDMPEFKDLLIPVFLDLETGKIGQASFIKQLQTMSANYLTEQDILYAFNKILIGINPGKVADLRKIKDSYKIFLLSNTNEIHYATFSDEIKLNNSTADFYSLFIKEYYSHLLGMRKPEVEIFKFVLKDSKLDPVGTLFVDDSIENIHAAASTGIQTFLIEHADSWKTLMNLLKIN